jgi:plasmid maintenance system antidote protein VapI
LAAKIKGMLVHRHEVGDPGEFSRVTDEELDLSLERQARALGLTDSTVNEILSLRCVKTKH